MIAGVQTWALSQSYARYLRLPVHLISTRVPLDQDSSRTTNAVAIGLAFVAPMLAMGLMALVALLWVAPDRRFARAALQ